MKEEHSTQIQINEGENKHYFKGQDFYDKNGFQDQLANMKNILEEQFNDNKSINGMNELKQIFKQVSMFRLPNYTIGLFSLITCFEGQNLLNDIVNRYPTKFTKKNKQLITEALKKLSGSQEANPIADINQNIKKIIVNKQVFQNLFFDVLGKKQAKQFFIKYFINKDPKLPSIQRLTVKQIIQNENNSQIVSLKQQQMQYFQRKQRRYSYAYLIPLNNQFWMMTVSSKQPALSNELSNLVQPQQKQFQNKKKKKKNEGTSKQKTKTKSQVKTNKEGYDEISMSIERNNQDSRSARWRNFGPSDKAFSIFITVFIFLALILMQVVD